ncbi:MAG: AEC family transporter, partial [Deltaproteobacteria bacterium]|nr:AEC family transporter [Deltaproteobacteria bacterium]
AGVVNRFVILVSLPALTLDHVHRLFKVSIYPVAMAWILFFLAAVGFVTVGRALGWSRRTVGALLLCAGLGNTSFVGFPLIEALYGREALRVAILTDQPGTFLALSTVGILAAALCAGRAVTLGGVGRRIFSFPPFLALLVALLTRAFAYPKPLQLALHYIALTLAPAALISVGLQLKLKTRFLKMHRVALSIGLIYKLLLGPALVAALYLFGLHQTGLSTQVTIAEAAMAPMVTGAIVATEYGLDAELANLLVGVGIPLSLLTVPAWAWVLRGV